MSREFRPFFTLPMDWWRSGAAAGLPDSALIALVHLFEHCQVSRNAGVMTERELRLAVRGIDRISRVLSRLFDSGLLVEGFKTGKVLYVNVSSLAPVWHLLGTCLALRPAMDVDGFGSSLALAWQKKPFVGRCKPQPEGYVWVLLHEAVFPAQRPEGRPKEEIKNIDEGEGVSRARVAARAATRAPARSRKKEINEENRTPSGSVRFSSARAAPLVDGVAARHAPGDLVAGDGRVAPTENPKPEINPEINPGNGADPNSPKEAMESMREIIRKSKFFSPGNSLQRKKSVEVYAPPPPQLPDDSNVISSNGHRGNS